MSNIPRLSRVLCLLALLAGVTTLAVASNADSALCHQAAAADQNGRVDIGWTKAKVKDTLGKPDRMSKDQNIWYYRQWAIQFTEGKVSGFPGAQG